MTREQRIVAAGAASGVATMALMVWLLSTIIPAPAIPDTVADRMAYALRWNVVAVLPLLLMIISIGNARFLSKAIDPTLEKDSPTMIVDGRVADNTMQQFIFFLVGSLALASNLSRPNLNLIAALSITFVIMRLAFWVGYRIKPVYRAFGFASTAYMNIGILIASLWLWID